METGVTGYPKSAARDRNASRDWEKGIGSRKGTGGPGAGAAVVDLPAGAVEDEDADVRLAERVELLRLRQQLAEGGPPRDAAVVVDHPLPLQPWGGRARETHARTGQRWRSRYKQTKKTQQAAEDAAKEGAVCVWSTVASDEVPRLHDELEVERNKSGLRGGFVGCRSRQLHRSPSLFPAGGILPFRA